MKTANIPVYGNIAVYIKYCAVLSKNRLYTKMLRINLFSIFTIKTPRALDRDDPDKCTLSIISRVLYRLFYFNSSQKKPLDQK